MKYVYGRIVLLGAVLLCSAGCGRVVQWGIDTFYQGETLKDEASASRKYIRSVTVYDQLSTEIMIDALWLSDVVRSGYVTLHSRLQGFNEERTRALLRRQLEENKHYLVFYVLVPRSLALDDGQAPWRLLLKVGDAVYAPAEIKTLDLGPEYKEIFGTTLNRFKAPYQVKFEALDAEDEPLLSEDVKAIELYVRSTTKEAVLSWPITKSGEIKEIEVKKGVCDEDCHRC